MSLERRALDRRPGLRWLLGLRRLLGLRGSRSDRASLETRSPLRGRIRLAGGGGCGLVLGETGTAVAGAGLAQVQEDQEVTLSDQAEVLLMELFVEQVDRIGQVVLAAIEPLEVPRRNPVHHCRQPVFGGQPVEELVPSQPDGVIQFRLDNLGLSRRLLARLLGTKRPGCLGKGQSPHRDGQSATQENRQPQSRAGMRSEHSAILDVEMSSSADMSPRRRSKFANPH